MSDMEARSPILVGLDPDPAKRTAVGWAAAEAQETGAPLLLLHTWNMISQPTLDATVIAGLRDAGQRVVDAAVDFVASAHPGVRVQAVLVEDDPAWALRDHAENARMVVVSTRAPDAAGMGLRTSPVVMPVLAHVRCPVVVVRENAPPAVSPPFFVVGVDGSKTSRHALEAAFRLASSRGAELRAVVARRSSRFGPVSERVARRQAQRLLHGEVAAYASRQPNVVVRERVVQGHPVEALSWEAVGALGVVVGTRGRGGFAGMLLGSVSQGVLQHARCPVVVVPPAGRDSSPA
ncbi:Universal stress protein [Streptomyces sp. enrichment culture]